MISRHTHLLLSIFSNLVLLLTSSSFHKPEHAIYLSLTEMEVNASDSSWLQIKVFSDDLQNAVRNFSDSYQPEELHKFFALNEALVETYFQEHLKIKINEQTVHINLESCSIEQDAHFLTFYFQPPSSPQVLQVQANFLMELFPTQTNVVKVLYRKETSYLKFTKGSGTQSLTWSH